VLWPHLGAVHFRDPTVCFVGPVVVLAAVAAADDVYHGSGPALPPVHTAPGDAVVVVAPAPVPAEVGWRVRSAARMRPAAVAAPICPAGRSIHHPIVRSCPDHSSDHSRSRSIAGRSTADHVDSRSPRTADAGLAVRILGHSVAAGVLGRNVVAGVPVRNVAAAAAVAAAKSCGAAVGAP
jgi:hypothetical protein